MKIFKGSGHGGRLCRIIILASVVAVAYVLVHAETFCDIDQPTCQSLGGYWMLNCNCACSGNSCCLTSCDRPPELCAGEFQVIVPSGGCDTCSLMYGCGGQVHNAITDTENGQEWVGSVENYCGISCCADNDTC